MNHFETELKTLKSDCVEQWELVSYQLKSSMAALSSMDKEKAKEIIEREKTVNELDLKIEKSCENIIALHTPVAIDLRFILALIKINSNLEKVGDIASRIAKFVVKSGGPFYHELITKTQTLEMFEEACDLFDDSLSAFKTNNAEKARNIFKRDEFINEINKSAFVDVINSIKENPENIEKYLKLLSVVRRIEKSGDISKSIAEEIIFYLEAKVLRHTDK
ncbi:phosphate signaling complex protein PhoU [Aurantibacillus circumpalustris]|uniref:phosphate signaling complex protein PhoU n=1 Tax=Aurantibacillus circumpalustris TaxID=3036359 RepID=UPI00295C29DC|nr:phosphate signaling complex protein PhoU [Aurantibacillus circumpalustris]